jgi:hypothetical protein
MAQNVTNKGYLQGARDQGDEKGFAGVLGHR